MCYHSSMQMLEDELGTLLVDPRLRPGVCVVVFVNCRAGMHSSVATSERMARDTERNWRENGVIVVVEHMDTDVERGIRRANQTRFILRSAV